MLAQRPEAGRPERRGVETGELIHRIIFDARKYTSDPYVLPAAERSAAEYGFTVRYSHRLSGRGADRCCDEGYTDNRTDLGWVCVIDSV